MSTATPSSHSAAAESWPIAAPREVGIRADLAETLDEGVDEGKLKNLHAVLVVRHGRLVVERYYEGEDQRWGQPLGKVAFQPGTLHDLRSVSKSIVGLLYGIALHAGKAPALDVPILENFPEYEDLAQDSERRRMTVAHALTMQLGLEWNEDLPYSDPNNSEIAMEFAPDRYRYILGRPFADQPGTQWRYNGGATALLATLIERGGGGPIFDFARKTLFDPMGINEAEWITGQDGEAAAASGLRLRPRDLARIGQLVLNDGVWNGRQLVPADWLAESFTPRAEVDEIVNYGYHWWLRNPQPDRQPWVAAFGNGGQRLVVFPRLDMVLVVLAGNYNKPDAWKLPVSVMVDYLLPAIER